MRLIALKSMTYATRRLLPGDGFDVADRDAKLLVGLKRARAATESTAKTTVRRRPAAVPAPTEKPPEETDPAPPAGRDSAPARPSPAPSAPGPSAEPEC